MEIEFGDTRPVRGMLTGATLFAGLILAAAGAAHADDNGNIQRVRLFVEALFKDRAAAEAMVGPDAEMGAGDVGGAFDFATVSKILANCSIDPAGVTTEPVPIPFRSADGVSVSLKCVGVSAGETRKAWFAVENDKIVVFYMLGDRTQPAFEKSR